MGHSLAIACDKIRADMVEAIEFPHLANKYGVQGVPRTVINENTTIEGAVPEPLFVAKVLEAVGLMTPEEVAKMVDEVSAEGVWRTDIASAMQKNVHGMVGSPSRLQAARVGDRRLPRPDFWRGAAVQRMGEGRFEVNHGSTMKISCCWLYAISRYGYPVARGRHPGGAAADGRPGLSLCRAGGRLGRATTCSSAQERQAHQGPLRAKWRCRW